jgi:hypothetical protein
MITENTIPHDAITDQSDIVPLKHKVPRVCIACHAEKLGMPVTPRDCLGFAECETCTKVPMPEESDEPLRES